jgi:hypothetical protein
MAVRVDRTLKAVTKLEPDPSAGPYTSFTDVCCGRRNFDTQKAEMPTHREKNMSGELRRWLPAFQDDASGASRTANTFILDFCPLELGENKCQTICDILFCQP